MTSHETIAFAVVAAPAASAVLSGFAPLRLVTPVARFCALGCASVGGVLSALALITPGRPLVTPWVVVDAASGLLIGVISVIGLASVLVSPAYLVSPSPTGLVRPERRGRTFFALIFLFWAILAAIPLVGNLGGAWLLIEATTAASALLVGFGGKPGALEAAWKYLILTSLGLGFALLGIVVLASGSRHGGLDALSWRQLAQLEARPQTLLVAYLLLIAGLAAKVGWAPVHNWLPDAHAEAPAPVSALLSAALLPSVLLVAWRSSTALAPALGEATVHGVLIGFGLCSLAVAVPFLWLTMPWKRLLAYSSLEHMGVIAIGIGFGSPLALAGVALHIVGHALAKALGFYAATPLADHDAGTSLAEGAGEGTPRALLAVVGLSLGALAGLPPSPLFASEVLIVAGGFAAGDGWAAAAAALLLALGFLGLAHTLIERTTVRADGGPATASGLRGVTVLAWATAPMLLALSAGSFWLPGSALARALVRGLQ